MQLYEISGDEYDVFKVDPNDPYHKTFIPINVDSYWYKKTDVEALLKRITKCIQDAFNWDHYESLIDIRKILEKEGYKVEED